MGGTLFLGISIPLLLMLAVGLLEAERAWTKTQRNNGDALGMETYVMDGSVILCVVLAFVSVVLLIVRLILGLLSAVGAAVVAIDTPMSFMIVLLSLAVVAAVTVIVLQRRRGPRPVPAAPAAPARPTAQPAQPAYDSVGYGYQTLPSMQAQRPQAQAAAPNQPQSFLDMKTESNRLDKERPGPNRTRLALLTCFVVLLGIGGYLLRDAIAAGVPVVTAIAKTTIANIGPAIAADQATTAALSATTGPAATSEAATVPAAAAEPQVRTVAVDALNLRQEPGTNGAILAKMKLGAQITVLGDQTTINGAPWVKVRFEQVEGWVNETFLQ